VTSKGIILIEAVCECLRHFDGQTHGSVKRNVIILFTCILFSKQTSPFER